MERPEVRTLFDAQLGVATRAQLYEVGVSPSTVLRALERDELTAILPGVVRPTVRPLLLEARLMAAQLYLGPTSYVTGSTAGRMRGMRELPATPLRCAVRERRRLRIPGWLQDAYTPLVARREIVELANGLRLARAHLMLLALALELDDHGFSRAAEDAWHKGLITPESSERYLNEHRGSGRRGIGRFGRWFEMVSGRARPAQSGFELDVIEELIAVGLPEPERQHPLLLADGGTIHLDVAWPHVCLAVEPGHSWWHGGDERMHADAARDRRCGRVGWQVIRYGEDARADLRAAALEVKAIYEVRRGQLSGQRPVTGDGKVAKESRRPTAS